MVYDDAEKLYAEVRKDGQDLLEEATSVLLPKSVALATAAVGSANGDIIGINTTFFPRRDIVEVPLASATAHLKSQVVHTSKDGSKGYALLNCTKGGHLARTSGLFSDCMPVSGSSAFNCGFVCQAHFFQFSPTAQTTSYSATQPSNSPFRMAGSQVFSTSL